MKKDNKTKKESYLVYAILFVVILVLAGVTVTYAFFQIETNYSSSIGNVSTNMECIDISYSESNTINLDYNYPITDSYALANVTPVTIEVKNNCANNVNAINYTLAITSLSNSTNYIDDRQIRINAKRKLGSEDETTLVDTKYLNNLEKLTRGNAYAFLNDDLNRRENIQSYANKTSYAIDSSSISNGVTNTYKIYLWVDYYEGDITQSGLNDNSTQGQNFAAAISLVVNPESTLETTSYEGMEVPEIADNNWTVNSSGQLYFLANAINGDITEEMQEMIEAKGYDENVVNITNETTINLTQNLYVQDTEWVPIGKDQEHAFGGTFDGNGYYVSGINVSDDTNPVGLFGYVSGTVNNLSVKDGYVESSGSNPAGGVVGYLAEDGEVNNVHNINTEVEGRGPVGGIAGNAYGNIYNSTSSGSITGNTSYTGGIVGGAYSNIEECENFGSVNALGNSTGGIAGYVATSGKISSSQNKGDIVVNNTDSSSTASSFVGGIGGIVVGHIEKSSNYGAVISRSYGRWNRAGGIAAALGTSAINASIIDCNNYGDISAIGFSTYLVIAGGLVGDTTNLVLINNSYNSGNVLGKSAQYAYIGGILGRVQGAINMANVYSKSKVIVEDSSTIVMGGIIGKMNGSLSGINNTYYYDVLDNNIGAISGSDYAAYNALETENIFNSYDEYNIWLTSNNG